MGNTKGCKKKENVLNYKWYSMFYTRKMEDVMDNFMSKLSQKINAQDSIKANFMADMAEKEHMKKQIQEYDAILQSMRNLYLKQEENNESFRQVAEKLEALCAAEAEKPEILTEIKEIIGKSDEFTHRECVKVYRNVQALLDEQNKKLEESTEAVKVQMESCKAADLTEDVAYLKRVLNMTYSSTKANRVWLVIVALLSAANLACILLIHFGLL